MSNHATHFDFSEALRQLKLGHRLRRSGWNGKGMCIYLCKGAINREFHGFKPGEHPTENNGSTLDGIRLGLFCAVDDLEQTHLPYIIMQTATGSLVHGWLASQTDLLASDWEIAP